MVHAISESPGVDVSADRETLTRDGIVGLKGAFSRDWAERMHEDMLTNTGGDPSARGGRSAVARAAGMWRSIRRPSVASPTSARTLGSLQCAWPCSATVTKSSKSASTRPLRAPNRRPWHRDFPHRRSRPGRTHRITSLAFNLTGGRRDAGHGSIRNRARHAMGRRARMETRNVSIRRCLVALRRAGRS